MAATVRQRPTRRQVEVLRAYIATGVGIGGACPGCDEPIAVAELVGLEVGP